MTYNVGDRVSRKGDLGTIYDIDFERNYPYCVEFDDATFAAFNEEELEEA